MRARALVTAMAIVLIAGVAYAQPADRGNVDWDNVKQIWNTLSPGEQAAYLAMGRDRAARAPGGTNLAPGDTCPGASNEIGSLPYGDSDTTVGLVDDYDLAASGTCAGGGSQFSGTGDGPDLVYLVETDVNCSVNVNMDPEAGVDLALYIVTDCASLASTCVGVDDAGGGGTAEDVAFAATAGTDYFIIVDGFNGASGAFDLSINETTATGCQLVPVELTGFSLE